jgi:hypothetical protein
MGEFLKYSAITLLLGLLFPAEGMSRGAQFDLWEPCASFRGDFRQVADTELVGTAKDLLSRFGLHRTPVICVGVPKEPLDVAMSLPAERDGKKYILIAFDAHFLREFRGPIDAVIAHEVAHYVTPDGGRCGSMETVKRYLRCEADVDIAASYVVGAAKMLRSHEETRAYLRAHKNHVPDTGDALEGLRVREDVIRSERLPE